MPPENTEGYVILTLADLLQSSRVNTDVNPTEDSHDHGEEVNNFPQYQEAYCGLESCPICQPRGEKSAPDAEVFVTCTEDCGCEDECEGTDEFFEQIANAPDAKAFFDAADDILSVAISTLSELAQDKNAEEVTRLEAANSLLGFWEVLILPEDE